MPKTDQTFAPMARDIAEQVATLLRDDPPLLTPWFNSDEAAAYLGLKPRGLETLRRNGNGPRFSRLSKGRLVRYFAADLDEFLRSGMVEGLGADK